MIPPIELAPYDLEADLLRFICVGDAPAMVVHLQRAYALNPPAVSLGSYAISTEEGLAKVAKYSAYFEAKVHLTVNMRQAHREMIAFLAATFDLEPDTFPTSLLEYVTSSSQSSRSQKGFAYALLAYDVVGTETDPRYRPLVEAAALHGHLDSMLVMGNLHLDGQVPDPLQAARWYMRNALEEEPTLQGYQLTRLADTSAPWTDESGWIDEDLLLDLFRAASKHDSPLAAKAELARIIFLPQRGLSGRASLARGGRPRSVRAKLARIRSNRRRE